MLLDRGFWSYGLFWQIQRQKAFFGIRLFKTAGLKHLRKLGPKDRLVQYAPTDPKWRKEGLPRSITLRLIDYQIPGFRPSAVVTNVLDPAVTSREDWVRLSTESEPGRRLDPGLYHRRWEIETSFSELKVIQGMRRGNLRSRTPEGIAFEIAGHVLFYLLVRWMMVEAAVKHGCKPLRLSFTHALRTTRSQREIDYFFTVSCASRSLAPTSRAGCLAFGSLASRPSLPASQRHKTEKYRQRENPLAS